MTRVFSDIVVFLLIPAFLLNSCSGSRSISIDTDLMNDCSIIAEEHIGKDVVVYSDYEMTKRGKLIRVENCRLILISDEVDTVFVDLKSGDILAIENNRHDLPGTTLLIGVLAMPVVIYVLLRKVAEMGVSPAKQDNENRSSRFPKARQSS